jgi:uncharacterized protein (DUF362 family)/Pyruvate/2-oxoacid:ferredoxin oxidoreductase delta subunit
MKPFVQPGQRVLVKPNLLIGRAPEEAVTTHPAVIQAVVELAQEAGGRVMVGDSPSGPFTVGRLRSAYHKSGWIEAAQRTGAELNYQIDGVVRLPHEDGHLLKLVDVAAYATQADVIISLPKLKTHGLMRFTGAIKNMFGVVPGLTKAGYHAKLQTADRFAHMLIDVLTLITPALTIMDGIVGMDGNGPSGGDPFPCHVLLASTDGIALDEVAVRLVGFDPQRIPPLRAAIERGLSSGRWEDIELLGDDFDALKVNGFRPAATGRGMSGLPSFLRNLVSRSLVATPQATAACTGCDDCERMCPVEAITIVDGRARMDLETCIRCYCCHEVCPERAIELRRPWLSRLVNWNESTNLRIRE